MNLIDRHVLRTFLRILLWSVTAFVAVFVLFDLLDHVDDFIDDDATLLNIGRYYLYFLPQTIDFVTPISMLLASMFTVGLLSKNREYTALLAAGVSLARLTRTLMLLGVVVALAAIAWREGVVAEANRRHFDVKDEIAGRERSSIRGRRDFTHIDPAGRVYVVGRFDTRPPTLRDLSIQTFTDSTMVARIDARRAIWRDDHWELQNGSVRTFSSGGGETLERFASRRLDDPTDEPSKFSTPRIEHEEMNWRQLKEFADWVDQTGGNSTPYRTDMAHKLSFPVLNALVVVLGVAFGAARRRTNLWAGFGITVSLAFVYYVLMDLGVELGRSGKVPVHLAVWAPNLVYAIAGGWMFLRANR